MTATVASYSKAASAKIDFSIDWSDWMATGDQIAGGGSSWSVEAISNDAAPLAIASTPAHSFTTDTHISTAYIEGGSPGNSYSVVNSITTSAGRQDRRAIVVTISSDLVSALAIKDANSYVSIPEADAYAARSPRAATWAALTDSAKGALLVASARIMERMRWLGARQTEGYSNLLRHTGDLDNVSADPQFTADSWGYWHREALTSVTPATDPDGALKAFDIIGTAGSSLHRISQGVIRPVDGEGSVLHHFTASVDGALVDEDSPTPYLVVRLESHDDTDFTGGEEIWHARDLRTGAIAAEGADGDGAVVSSSLSYQASGLWRLSVRMSLPDDDDLPHLRFSVGLVATAAAGDTSSVTRVWRPMLVSGHRDCDYRESGRLPISVSRMMQWPRTGLVYRDGTAVPEHMTPPEIKAAQIELAMAMMADSSIETAAAGSGQMGVRRVKAGSAEVEYFSPTATPELARGRLPPAAQELAAPFLAGQVGTKGEASGIDRDPSFPLDQFDLSGAP